MCLIIFLEEENIENEKKEIFEEIVFESFLCVFKYISF